MNDISLFLKDCVNNLNIYELKLRSTALSLNNNYGIIPLEILNSFGFLLVNFNSGVVSLVLNSMVLAELNEIIFIPEEIKLVHIINSNFSSKYYERALIKHSDSTILLYHKEDFMITSKRNNYKYLKYSDLLNDKLLSGDSIDTLFVDEISIQGKERKIIKNIVNRIPNVNNLILLLDSYNLNELYYGCDFDAMLSFIEHDILKYMRKVTKWINDFNLKNVHIKVLLHNNNKYYGYLLYNDIIKNKKSLLTSGLSYGILSMSEKYGLNYEDNRVWFLETVQSMESKLNMIYKNIVVEFII